MLSKDRPSLVVQPYAPPDFVPIAWTVKGQDCIKCLRVPVAESAGQDKAAGPGGPG